MCLGRAKTALKFKYEILLANTYTIHYTMYGAGYKLEK